MNGKSIKKSLSGSALITSMSASSVGIIGNSIGLDFVSVVTILFFQFIATFFLMVIK